MKNKGIVKQIKEKEADKEDRTEVTVDDIRQWKKELDAQPVLRKYKVWKWCPHGGNFFDCPICFKEMADRFFNDENSSHEK